MKQPCKVDGCLKPSRRWGMCNTHSTRWLSHGDTSMVLQGRSPPKFPGLFMREWVLAILAYDGDDCLSWPYAKDKNGYGLGEMGGKLRRAHRYICSLVNGEPPTSKHEAAHSCGNGHLGCVNPNHLRWATTLENQRERWEHAKARQAGYVSERRAA